MTLEILKFRTIKSMLTITDRGWVIFHLPLSFFNYLLIYSVQKHDFYTYYYTTFKLCSVISIRCISVSKTIFCIITEEQLGYQKVLNKLFSLFVKYRRISSDLVTHKIGIKHESRHRANETLKKKNQLIYLLL